ncbi:sulfatase-like hydrolase/transferase [Pelagicoccus enzymogenes]|uniref:sulfatase-like hydrolase/transferase n=1 Tax=Pelagicoccus enzymogenes TaxID=2773457 RepID=UPI00280EBC9A|nr:sulfatase-like hydrolase/transferase [Pelagicoccus enzymogenes]MDQ8199418.1 sulfatase-like hydrolase/transferase [Pelagicoccus enzymogenes]
MNRFLTLIVVVVCICNARVAASGESSFPKFKSAPNILFLFVDDLGWGDVGIFHQESRRISGDRSQPYHSTPYLDALARQGGRLTHHYVSAPVCAPSRASLFQGVTQGHANVRDNQFDKGLDENQTLGTVLRAAGYDTALIGKWGLQGEDAFAPHWPSHPLERGFDYFYGYVRHVDGHEHYPVEQLYYGSKHARKGPVAVYENRVNVTEGLEKSLTSDLWTARAKKWIVEQKSARPDHPFFLFLSYDTPHAVLELPTGPYPEGGGLEGGMQWLGEKGRAITTAAGVPDSWFHPDYAAATYDHDNDPETPGMAWPDVYRRYATLVRRIDDSVGDLMTLLEDLEIDRETLVVFASDNGPSAESYLDVEYSPEFFGSYGPFDGIKRDLWEGGMRTPAIVRWPGKIAAGKMVDLPSATWDWLPTFADVAEVAAPARADGVSLLPVLTGETDSVGREALYFEYFNNSRTPSLEAFEFDRRGRKRGQMQAVRLGRYMGVRYDLQSANDAFEIYDLSTDPKQKRNLALEAGEGVNELQKRLKEIALQSRRPDGEAPRPYDRALIPSVEPTSSLKNGLLWQTFPGDFPWVPRCEGLDPRAEGVTQSIEPPDEAGAMLHWGYLEVPVDGAYRFAAEADGGVVVRLHRATILNSESEYESKGSVSGEVMLSAGYHPISIHSRHPEQNASRLSLQWSGPGFATQPIYAEAFTHQRDR